MGEESCLQEKHESEEQAHEEYYVLLDLDNVSKHIDIPTNVPYTLSDIGTETWDDGYIHRSYTMPDRIPIMIELDRIPLFPDGTHSEIPNEKEFFDAVKASERVVCHFYRENWPCKVVDKHLAILAKKHNETRFVKINAEKSPYLSEKLRIVVLPTIALVKNAEVEDYVVGFDELGGRDDFSTKELEERLAKAQVIIHEGESSLITSKSKAPTRNVRQSSYSSDSD